MVENLARSKIELKKTRQNSNFIRKSVVLRDSKFDELGSESKTDCMQTALSCIVPISDYGSEIWYNAQKKFEKLFQNLQNRMIRKILGTFKTTTVQAMEIESHICFTSQTTIIDEKSKVCFLII